jgi:phosphoserine phosphatase
MRPTNTARWRVACFDLDGTLVPGTTICRHLGQHFSHGEIIRELDTKYAEGSISNQQIAEAEASLFEGVLQTDVEAALATIPFIAGIAETLEVLRTMHINVLLTTITWEFASRHVARAFGFDAWTGCLMNESHPGTLSGRLELVCDENDKRDFVLRYCEQRDVNVDQVFAVGDSRSDVPLFRVVGHSIAINASSAAKAAASSSIDTFNLTDVLKLVPGLLS